MILKVDHIGIAVKNLRQSIRKYETLFNRPPEHVEEVPAQKVRVAMFQAGESAIELLEAMDASSPIHTFIEKRGEGIHHLCLRVDDLHRTLDQVREAGFEIIEQADDRGAGGSRVAFLHPRSTGGVLIELVEKNAR